MLGKFEPLSSMEIQIFVFDLISLALLILAKRAKCTEAIPINFRNILPFQEFLSLCNLMSGYYMKWKLYINFFCDEWIKVTF